MRRFPAPSPIPTPESVPSRALVGIGALALVALLTPTLRAAQDDPAARARILTEAAERLEVASVRGVDVETITAESRIIVPVELDGVVRPLELERRSLRSPSFRLRVQEAHGEFVERDPEPVRTYRGTVAGQPGILVAASVTPDGGLRAIVDRDGEMFAIQPAADGVPGAPTTLHVVYPFEDVRALENRLCGVLAESGEDGLRGPGTDARGVVDIYTTEIAFDADVQFYNANGSSVANTVADIEDVMNSVTFIYERDTQITYEFTEILVRTSEPDPYTTSDPSSLLGQFAGEWASNQGDIHRDIAHLMTGRDLNGGVIGIAYLNAICSSTIGYGLSQSRFTGNFAARVALTAHELGHNYASPHCSGADCRIMCPGLGGCTGDISQFGAASVNFITNFRDRSPCVEVIEDPLTLPFADTFEDTTLDFERWSEVVRISVASHGTNEPSPPYAVNFDAQQADEQDDLVSFPLMLAGESNVSLSFYLQELGVEPGQSLFFEYLNSGGTWSTIDQFVSDGTASDWFAFFTYPLTGDALHDEFRLRIRPEVGSPLNDWFVDNLAICAATVAPSVSPAGSSVGAGGTLEFDASVLNLQASSQATEAWIDVVGPDASPVFAAGNPKFGPQTLNLPASGSRGRSDIRLRIPGGTASAEGYQLILYTGDFDAGLVCASAEFEFEVTP